MHCNLQVKQKVPLCTGLCSCSYFVYVTVPWLKSKFRGPSHLLVHNLGTFHLDFFSKEKECREFALKSTADLPVKIKHTPCFSPLGWMVVSSLYMSRLINLKIHNSSVWAFSCLQVCSFPAKWKYVCSSFFVEGKSKGIFWLHFSHWWVCQWQKHIKTVCMKKFYLVCK